MAYKEHNIATPPRGLSRRFVYLDTQDYSRLADAASGHGSEELLPVLERLRKFAKEGSFDFCFSYMIVAELLQLNPQDIEITRRKAELMEELCGARAFPNVFWLLGAEIAAAAERHGFAPSQRSNSLEEIVQHGKWIQTEIPEINAQLEGFHERAETRSKELILKKLGRPLNRQERRRYSKMLSIDDVRQVISSEPLYQVIAGTDLVDKFAKAFLHRRVPLVADEFFRFLARPTRLVLSHSNLHSMGFLNDQLATLKDGFYRGLGKLRDDFDVLQATHGSQTRTLRAEMLRGPLQEHLVKMATELRGNLARYGAPLAYFDNASFNEDMKSISFLRLWLDLLLPYLLMVTDDARMRRAILPSDMVDLMHALYIPHCRVWRSDRYFANLVSPVAQNLGCRVVSRLVDLPTVLDNILQKEGAERS